MELNIEALGFSKDELFKRVVDVVVDRYLSDYATNDDGDTVKRTTKFERELSSAVKDRVDEAIAKIAEKHILPNAEQYVENICLQKTNEWGDKIGEALSFRQYLVKRAEEYLTEKVNYEGKGKNEDRGYSSWKGCQTRITHLVEKHLYISIENAMKDALKITNSAISVGIAETCKIKLQEIMNQLKITVATK